MAMSAAAKTDAKSHNQDHAVADAMQFNRRQQNHQGFGARHDAARNPQRDQSFSGNWPIGNGVRVRLAAVRMNVTAVRMRVFVVRVFVLIVRMRVSVVFVIGAHRGRGRDRDRRASENGFPRFASPDNAT